MANKFNNSHFKAKALYKFLKQKRCLREYVTNVIQQHNPTHHEPTKRYVLSNDLLQLIRDYHCSIDHSFTWAATPQGHDFWSKLDEEFEHKWEVFVHE